MKSHQLARDNAGLPDMLHWQHAKVVVGAQHWRWSKAFAMSKLCVALDLSASANRPLFKARGSSVEELKCESRLVFRQVLC